MGGVNVTIFCICVDERMDFRYGCELFSLLSMYCMFRIYFRCGGKYLFCMANTHVGPLAKYPLDCPEIANTSRTSNASTNVKPTNSSMPVEGPRTPHFTHHTHNFINV